MVWNVRPPVPALMLIDHESSRAFPSCAKRQQKKSTTPPPCCAESDGAAVTIPEGPGFLAGKRVLLHDRDPLFTDAFRETLAAASVETVRLPPRSPNLNAYAERFVRTIKEACLDRLILVSERSLRRAIHEFVEHYHHERNHQGMGNQLLVPITTTARRDLPIACRSRLGGLLKYYHRPAA